MNLRFMRGKHPTLNLEHPTSSFRSGWAEPLVVRRWMLDVGCSSIFSFSPEVQP